MDSRNPEGAEISRVSGDFHSGAPSGLGRQSKRAVLLLFAPGGGNAYNHTYPHTRIGEVGVHSAPLINQKDRWGSFRGGFVQINRTAR